MTLVGSLDHQVVEIRDQAIAKVDGVTNDGQHLGVHPGFIGAAVYLPGVDGEARMEDAILNPAHE